VLLVNACKELSGGSMFGMPSGRFSIKEDR